MVLLLERGGSSVVGRVLADVLGQIDSISMGQTVQEEIFFDCSTLQNGPRRVVPKRR
jgi:hypothetical protein